MVEALLLARHKIRPLYRKQSGAAPLQHQNHQIKETVPKNQPLSEADAYRKSGSH